MRKTSLLSLLSAGMNPSGPRPASDLGAWRERQPPERRQEAINAAHAKRARKARRLDATWTGVRA